MIPKAARVKQILRLLSSISQELIYSIFISIPLAFYRLFAVTVLDAPPQFLDAAPSTKPMHEHKAQVEELHRKLQKSYKLGEQVSIQKKVGQGHSARSNLYKNEHTRLDFSSLNCLLSLDPKERVADVEAGVTFSSLCTATLEHGLIPPVVPEFRSITIVGACQGLGIESTSIHNGTFDTSILDADLLAPASSRIITRQEDPKLWSAVVGSNGTIALCTRAKVRLIPASKWIKIRYVRYSTPEAFARVVLKDACEPLETWFGENVLCDAMVLGDCTIAMFGGCISDEEQKAWKAKRYRDHPGQPFFYQHVEEIAKGTSSTADGATIHEEVMPTLEYLFRYDRGGFWAVGALAEMIPPLKWMLSTPLLRPITYALLTTQFLYKVALLLSDSHREETALLQDVTVPLSDNLSSFSDLLNWLDDLKPIWLCPVRAGDANLSHPRLFALDGKGDQKVMMNVGIYGIPKRRKGRLAEVNRELERKVIKSGGHKALYAFVYASREEFWSWFDVDSYEGARREYGGNKTFAGLWEKVKR